MAANSLFFLLSSRVLAPRRPSSIAFSSALLRLSWACLKPSSSSSSPNNRETTSEDLAPTGS